MGKKGQDVKKFADDYHDRLTPMIGSGFKPSRSMCGAIALYSAGGVPLFAQTANYGGTDYHVEIHLLALLYEFVKKSGWGEYTLPAWSTVYLYVYDSPCKQCTTKLARALNLSWQNGRNSTVRWKLSFSQWYTGSGFDRYWDVNAAKRDYKEQLSDAGYTGWRIKQAT